MENRTVLALFGMIAPIITWIFAFLWPGRKASVAYNECKNKCRIMALVQNLQSYMDPEGKTTIESIVEKCYALGSFPALWAVEGVGKDVAEWHMARNENPTRILIDTKLDPKWDGAWLMLHAGICRKVHAALTEYAPDSVGFYWRGIGRSVYFHPINFIPGFLRPCRAIHMCEGEAPNLEM